MNKSVNFVIRVSDNGTIREVEVNAEDLRDALNGVESSSKKASDGASMLGSTLKKYLTVGAVIGVLKNAVETIASFERANSELASVLGTTTEGVQGLSESAAELGRTTEFTASEVTSLQTSLARLGFNESQITDMQESVLKFAAAVGTDLGSAADFAGSALRAFGLSASDSQSLLDIMAASTSKSALSFSKLQESISTVGPVANAFGLKAEEVTSLLGVLSNAGFDASSAATALRNILLNLADSNGKLATGLGHTAKTMPEIIDALKELRDKGVDLNSTLEMTDKRSVAAFAALVAGADDVAQLNTQLQDADGSLEQMYETMTDNVVGAFRGLQSAWEGFILEFQKSKGPIADVGNFLTDTVNRITDKLHSINDKAGSSEAISQGKDLMARMWGGTIGNQLGDEESRKKLLEDINGQIASAEKSVDTMSNAVEKAVGHAQKKLYKDALENERFNLNMLLAAREDYFDRIKWYSGEYYKENNVAEDGGNTELSGISDDIDKYRKVVESAVNVNAAFNAGFGEMDVRLKTMKSGIAALISKYGAEDAEVQKLLGEYYELNKQRVGADSPVGRLELTTPQAKVLNPVTIAKSADATKDMVSSIDTMKGADGIINSLASAFGSLGQVVSSAAGSWLEWVGNLLRAVAQAVPSINTLTVALGKKTEVETAASVAGAASSVASTPVVGPGLAVAAAATVLASILAAISSIPKFASGGIAYGPTLGLFGEYAGAANNPEVVAPLSKLRDLIGSDIQSGTETIELRARGRDLVAIVDKQLLMRRRG